MEIYDAMSALREKALMDRTFRQKLLDTYRSETPLSEQASLCMKWTCCPRERIIMLRCGVQRTEGARIRRC